MVRVSTERSELEVSVVGEGESVLTIHGAFYGGMFGPLSQQPALNDRYQVITYDRHGYGKSSRPDQPYDLTDVTADALDVLRHVGVDRAHVVGHSAGSPYAMQLAMDHPETVHSLTVIEPVLPSPAWAEFSGQHFAPAGQVLAGGDAQAAFDMVFTPVYGSSNYRAEMGSLLPEDAFDQCAADLRYLFMCESPALQQFTLGPDEAKRIRQPTLIVRGGQTEPVWESNCEFLKGLLPHAEERVIPESNHFCLVLKADETAEAMSSFFANHPIHGHSTR